jgi:3-hydroxyisobutyrate dehydrogenase-like beta-hydroxyacid dehydrogenase
MGSAIGRRLRERGARVVTSLAGRGAQSVKRVAEAGLEVAGDDDTLVRDASFVLSIVPPGVALDAARAIAPALARAAYDPVFVDCNAVSPATALEIAAIVASTRRGFIDASIIGGPPSSSLDAAGGDPRIYASGPDAVRLMRLREFGLDIAVMQGPIGAASGLKMCYAGLSKGLNALGAAIIGAAEREGLSAALHAELERSQPALLSWLSRRVPDMLPKAYRWIAEMEEISSFLGSGEPGGVMFDGAARLFERIAANYERGRLDSEVAAQIRRFFSLGKKD